MRALSLGALFNFMNRQGYKEVEEEERGGHKVVNYKTKHWKKKEKKPRLEVDLFPLVFGGPLVFFVNGLIA